MAIYNPTQVTISPFTSSFVNAASVSASGISVILLSANSNRRGVTILNESRSTLYIDFSLITTIQDYALKIAAEGYFEMPFNYTGPISGIWETEDDGKALIREFI